MYNNTMTRRDLLKTGLGTILGFSILTSLLIYKPEEVVEEKLELTPEQMRESIIAAALNTPEGRKALAEAMTEPIKTSLMYHNIGRKLLNN